MHRHDLRTCDYRIQPCLQAVCSAWARIAAPRVEFRCIGVAQLCCPERISAESRPQAKRSLAVHGRIVSCSSIRDRQRGRRGHVQPQRTMRVLPPAAAAQVCCRPQAEGEKRDTMRRGRSLQGGAWPAAENRCDVAVEGEAGRSRCVGIPRADTQSLPKPARAGPRPLA
jgi:hypothetical protein